MKRALLAMVVLAGLLAYAPTTSAADCTPTGYFRDGINMTAALVNPPVVKGPVDATGCNVGVYYDAGHAGTISKADIYGANYFGVLVNGDDGIVNVDIVNSSIHDIGETPHNGTQHGVGIYYRGFNEVSAVTGRIVGNSVFAYQKGGIVANGIGVQVNVSDNTVTGDGHVYFIAMNGIQIGYGATASVMKNVVSGNSFIGFPGDGSASGGILVVGGPGYDGAYTTNVRIMNNTLTGNDVGVYLSNLDGDYLAPSTATNIKVVNNTIVNNQCFNTSYQAGVSDVGNNDKIITNAISGAGYVGCSTVYNPSGFPIDADPSFTNRPKVHANK